MTLHPEFIPLHPVLMRAFATNDLDEARRRVKRRRDALDYAIAERLPPCELQTRRLLLLTAEVHADAIDPLACAVITEANAIVAAACGAEGIEP